MGRNRDDLGGRVKSAKLGKDQPLPSPFEDERYLIPQAEFVLIPLLATDPLPYLLDQTGEPVDIDGRRLRKVGMGKVSRAIRRLQKEARSNSSDSSCL